ncbi:MAG TPA: PEPxxWA-CTERM sorting domain-containing protein [Polymorphobacter sp.]|nr:PEPxxWA-CTERM sorting domain-containing protein [Polymorphobacter sp.]
MSKTILLFGAAALALGAIGAAPVMARGTIILEGSDAIGFHAPFGQAAAIQYADQTWSALGGSSPKTVLVVGTNVLGGFGTSGTHAITSAADLSGVGALSQYAAIYFMAGGGCCSSNAANIAGRNTDLRNYYNAGGTIEIGDYDGQAAWDFLVGGSNNANWVAGVGGNLVGPGCTDGETVTAVGIANGFTQPAPVGCWTHQAYNSNYFATLGFTKSYFDADPQFATDNPGTGPYSSLLSNGNTITGGGNVPEPAAWTMMIMGFGLIGATMRRRATRVSFG